MAFQVRHRWMIGRINDALALNDEVFVETELKPYLVDMNKFFSDHGPTVLVFYYQPVHLPEDDRPSNQDDEEAKEEPPEHHKNRIVLANDASTPLRNRGVYFLRKRTGETLDPFVANDNSLGFGTLNRSLLMSFESLLSNVYKPLIENKPSWGYANPTETHAFLQDMDRFKQQMVQGVSGLSTGLELKKPSMEMIDKASMGSPPEGIASLSEMLEGWCIQVEGYLDESEDGTAYDLSLEDEQSSTAGPKTVLEAWHRRMQRLTSITDQLKSKECRGVISVLTSQTKSSTHSRKTTELFSLLRKWRQIDLSITEAANEAKDNVKYLTTLEKFLDPLYAESPKQIIETIPALMNSIKMIHTIARYFNTTERMTGMFMKISNQLINRCKEDIIGPKGDPVESIWEQKPSELIVTFEACLKLNEVYQSQYRTVKDKLLAVPKGKQFDFSESHIFGKIDLFCRRLFKLVDTFSTIEQFESISRFGLEGMNTLMEKFHSIVADLKGKKHNLLDFFNQDFDRDYVEFNVRINDLERSLQQFINRSFESITSIESSLALLKRFHKLLNRQNLKADLDSKFMVIFHNYGLDLSTVQDLYEKHKHSPPVNRNMPPIAGNILWSRHLLKRIEDPMRKFESNKAVLNTREAKRIIKTYNKVAKTLVAFEYLWYEAWCKSVKSARAGLQATIIIRDPSSGELHVNFDTEIFQLIREAKCLTRMKLSLPEDAKLVLMQEDKFKCYYNQLRFMLSECRRVLGSIAPVVRDLLRPQIKDLESRLKPGMVTLTWTSMNIDSFRVEVEKCIEKLEALVLTINDIIENRIEKNLKQVGRVVLINIPSDGIVTLDDFVQMQSVYVKQKTQFLCSKNIEIETAVKDVLDHVSKYKVEGGIPSLDESEASAVKSHYNRMMYQAILQATKNSLSRLKTRVCSKKGTSFLYLEKPFFEVDVQLSVPSVRLLPSLEEVQRAINKSAQSVIWCSKNILDWDQDGANAGVSFYDKIGKDVQIVRSVLLLTGSLLGTQNQVKEYLAGFSKYDWLWKDDMENAYAMFMKGDPKLQDFETELIRFVALENEIKLIPSVYNIGALSLNTSNIKLQLRSEASQWKVQYSDNLHHQARSSLNSLLEYIKSTQERINRKVVSIEALKYVMEVLKEVRERESTIETEITPILDMYEMLDHYLPAGVISKEEMDRMSVLRNSWRKLVDAAEDRTDELAEVQGDFKKELVRCVKTFGDDVAVFHERWESDGPMSSDLRPSEAMERLHRFKGEYESHWRKFEEYRGGEELFALERTEYPALVRVRKDLTLLEDLYKLYTDVCEEMDVYRNKPWMECIPNIEEMKKRVFDFEMRCNGLPERLHEWQAYTEVKRDISNFLAILPLLQELTKPSIKQRHWDEIARITGIPFDAENDTLKALWKPEFLKALEEIEEICHAADKQLEIEAKLENLREKWATTSFEFVPWHQRDCWVLKGFAAIIEELEESQLTCRTLLSMKQVKPFHSELSELFSSLSNTIETLESWSKVQLLWISLESVFTGGDIAKQMPLEAKKFSKIDKEFCKIMEKSKDTHNVIKCCSSDVLKNSLPILHQELERCQKSLEGYLERKRAKFPRFYFVSNPVLLQILSRGSDLNAVQAYYEKLFDSIGQVVYDGSAGNAITHIKQVHGDDEEEVQLLSPVMPSGNIETWLTELEMSMKTTMKQLCKNAYGQCDRAANPDSIQSFADGLTAQFALLGLQFSWTRLMTTVLQNCKQSKSAMVEMNKLQLAILTALSRWCLSESCSRMKRIKLETMVTIQVHQRDVFLQLFRLYKERKINGVEAFEWQKQTRFYWHAEGERESEVKLDPAGDKGDCVVSVCDIDFSYSYEYLGCKERLVITPLTDRCYITLTQALGMKLGGAPLGPAGTGKTETVKDLGRALGIYVIVTNCTDQQRYTDMAKIFKGLSQAGLWGCFDEFNRIELPVLSVVAQQVLSISNAKKSLAKSFVFPGDEQAIAIKHGVGYFITMNPGYAGRQELPENLKVQFRSVAMMVPDREMIIRVKLCSVGYTKFSELAKKFDCLYRCSTDQLSKQPHYDFGLRNILSVLRTAGMLKRLQMQTDEYLLLYQTLRKINLSKLVFEDVPLFLALLNDLFPAHDTTSSNDISLEEKMTDSIHQQRLQPVDTWQRKLMQVDDAVKVRHGIMVIGPSGVGKSMLLKVLAGALSSNGGVPHKLVKINPKAMRAEELFGETEAMSGEWINGVFSAIWAKYNNKERKDIAWIICDGPVDSLWIENLNTVLDDNKILTLANGDRLPMTDNVKLFFETLNLNNASPATVSRTGIIYVSEADLGWMPIVYSWLDALPEAQAPILKELVERIALRGTPIAKPKPSKEDDSGEGKAGGKETGQEAEGLFEFVKHSLNPSLNPSPLHVMSVCTMLISAVLEMSNLSHCFSDLESELERVLLFGLCWSLGGFLDVMDRQKLEQWLRGRTKQMPKGSIYDHSLDPETLNWQRAVAKTWDSPSKEDLLRYYPRVLVPTKTFAIGHELVRLGKSQEMPVLVCGSRGTFKTSLVESYFSELDERTECSTSISFNYATSTGVLQSMIQAQMEKRGGKTYGPPSGKVMSVLLDDLSMPEANQWGDQPTLELVRHLVETKMMACLEKDKRGDMRTVEDAFYLATMSTFQGKVNKGSSCAIPSRLKRHFFIVHMLEPNLSVVDEIFGQILRHHLLDEIPALTDLASKLIKASFSLWSKARTVFLPTPLRLHYHFSMRDLRRVFHGLLRPSVELLREDTNTKPSIVMLWRHEVDRVLGDKLCSIADKEQFSKMCEDVLAHELGKGFNTSWLYYEGGKGLGKKSSTASQTPPVGPHSLLLNAFQSSRVKEPIYFVDLELEKLNIRGNVNTYAPVSAVEGLFQQIQGIAPDVLVLFRDAFRHLLRVVRILGLPRGNALLVGVGGSGRQTLVNVATNLLGLETKRFKMTREYNLEAFLEDLRKLYKWALKSEDEIVLVLTDAEIKEESFLEVLNTFLLNGSVPKLFSKDEYHMLVSEMRSSADSAQKRAIEEFQTAEEYYIDYVRSRLHIILCMSPSHKRFAERVKRFPAVSQTCTVDWYLPWPKEALIAVASVKLADFPLQCEDTMRDQILQYFGNVHMAVIEQCGSYMKRMRRKVEVTSTSFLSLLQTFQKVYREKLDEVEEKEERVRVGLKKLEDGAVDVEEMKVALAAEKTKLAAAEKACNEMLSSLEISSLRARKEAEEVNKIKQACEAEADKIMKEKKLAADDLAQAQPFLDEAEAAVNSIKPNDLNELKKLPKPGDIIKLVFDGVMLLRMFRMDKVHGSNVTLGFGREKKTVKFIKDSYSLCQKTMLADSSFLKSLFHFSQYDKDQINDETIEFLMPYIELENFSSAVARNASKACEGLCSWVIAMVKYNEAAKVVQPKLLALELAQARLDGAMEKLKVAEGKLSKCKDTLQGLQTRFQAEVSAKQVIEEGHRLTKTKMEQATALIDGLKDERVRWSKDAESFAEIKQNLVGDCAVAAGFTTYCGPFDQHYRADILSNVLIDGLQSRKIAVTADFDLTDFLLNVTITGRWSLQGLPTDTLSLQNGLLATREDRFPFLIDPQGQGLRWIMCKERARLPEWQSTTLTHKKFKEQLELCMAEGKVLIVHCDGDIDASLSPVFDKAIVRKGKSAVIYLEDRALEFDPSFQMVLVTKLSNPFLTAEAQSKIRLINFSVTFTGLEEQLLSKVIQKEQRSLEEQLQQVLEAVTEHTNELFSLNNALLERLTANEGNLLDDLELIQVLAQTKSTARGVKEKLVMAKETRQSIRQKRDQYRSIATRGSVLYFSMVEAASINPMYQTSLEQFMTLFITAIDRAEKSSLSVLRRVSNIIEELTQSVFTYIARGIYTKDKLVFLLLLLLKMLTVAEVITEEEASLFLNGGAHLDIHQAKANPFQWLPDPAYLNILALSTSVPVFNSIFASLSKHERLWRRWYDLPDPEKQIVPDLEESLRGERGAFCKLMLIRCMREDRTVTAIYDLIKGLQQIQVDGVAQPALGESFTESKNEPVDAIVQSMQASIPAIYLLSPGSDPTEDIEHFCRRHKHSIAIVSMGEGQEPVARSAIDNAAQSGGFVLIQNAHLGLPFVHSLNDLLDHYSADQEAQGSDVLHPDFRLVITTEPVANFSVPLLQRSLKVTNEAPTGLRGGLYHAYSTTISQDKLDRVDSDLWRKAVYALCFFHSVIQVSLRYYSEYMRGHCLVQERKKFGSLGWCIPYEFNASDLHASLFFLEKHLYAGELSWPTLQYMIGEVQYGGRVTDTQDRYLLNRLIDMHLRANITQPNFTFNPSISLAPFPDKVVYSIPEAQEVEGVLDVVDALPEVDPPEILGLHPNAEAQLQINEWHRVSDSLLITRPIVVSEQGEGFASVVHDKLAEVEAEIPEVPSAEECLSRVENTGGLAVATNLSLIQEVGALRALVKMVREDIETVRLAVKGEVATDAKLDSVIQSLAASKPPRKWIFASSGDEISWKSRTLSSWVAGLTERYAQLDAWMTHGLPNCTWLGGLLNPQGFLTALKQEFARAHLAEGWYLDTLTFHADITTFDDPVQAPEGAYFISGIMLEGCTWSKEEYSLIEAAPKVLVTQLPLIALHALTFAQKRAKDTGQFAAYDCPIYRYPCREEVVMTLTLPTREQKPEHWVARGAAALLSTEGL